MNNQVAAPTNTPVMPRFPRFPRFRAKRPNVARGLKWAAYAVLQAGEVIVRTQAVVRRSSGTAEERMKGAADHCELPLVYGWEAVRPR